MPSQSVRPGSESLRFNLLLRDGDASGQDLTLTCKAHFFLSLKAKLQQNSGPFPSVHLQKEAGSGRMCICLNPEDPRCHGLCNTPDLRDFKIGKIKPILEPMT